MCPSEVLISLLLVLQIATLAPLQKKFTLLKSQLELKTYDLSLFEGQAEQSEHHKVSMPLPNRFSIARIAVNLVLQNHGLNSETSPSILYHCIIEPHVPCVSKEQNLGSGQCLLVHISSCWFSYWDRHLTEFFSQRGAVGWRSCFPHLWVPKWE